MEVDGPPVQEGPRGIRGSLIVPVAALIVYFLLVSTTSLYALMRGGTSLAAMLMDSTSPVKSLALNALVGALLASVLPTIALVLLVRKSRHFPSAYVVWTAITAAFGVIVAAQSIARGADFRLHVAAIYPVIWTAIWAPYMLKSVRVRNTFVN